MYRPHTNCRVCGKQLTKTVYDLGVQPLANDFVVEWSECAGFAPLKVLFCEDCSLGQLSVVVRPDIIYKNYPYVTSRSQTMQEHFKLLWEAMKNELGNSPTDIIEIGSNDGLFLNHCKEMGAVNVLGIDPAENLQPKEVPSICGLFDEESARRAYEEIPNPSVIIARHVFAHMDDWSGFISDLDVMCGGDTIVMIEVPYVGDMLNGAEFDTIYHEHLSYVSFKSVQRLLEGTSFHIHNIRLFNIHGGAAVIILRHNTFKGSAHPHAKELLEAESITLDSWEKFAEASNRKIATLQEIVRERPEQTFCGYGASAKSTVWINACGFTGKQIGFIVDCTPSKQGKYSPASQIPIVPESELMAKMPDYAILFSWNFGQEIVEKNYAYVEAGGQFVIPDRTGILIESAVKTV
jgi:hypothetical protein